MNDKREKVLREQLKELEQKLEEQEWLIVQLKNVVSANYSNALELKKVKKKLSFEEGFHLDMIVSRCYDHLMKFNE